MAPAASYLSQEVAYPDLDRLSDELDTASKTEGINPHNLDGATSPGLDSRLDDPVSQIDNVFSNINLNRQTHESLIQNDQNGGQHSRYDLRVRRPQAQPSAGPASTVNGTLQANRVYTIDQKLCNLPTWWLFCSSEPRGFKSLPVRLQWLSHMTALKRERSLYEVLRDSGSGSRNHQRLWNYLREQLPSEFSASDTEALSEPWLAPLDTTLRASLDFTANNDQSLFSLDIKSLGPLLTRSHRLQRRFGFENFLHVTIPSLNEVPKEFKNSERFLKQKVLEWLCTETHFLGRKWRAFWVEQQRKSGSSKSQKNKLRKEGLRTEIVFVCADGIQLPHCEETNHPSGRPGNFEKFLSFLLAPETNGRQPYLKIYSRLKLALTSRARPTLIFQPDQILNVADILSDDSPEDARYDDLSPHYAKEWERFHNDCQTPRVMNDGCSRLSSTAADRIWNLLGQVGSSPSVFQARIGAAKGLWMKCPDSSGPVDDKVWIEITPSQEKIQPHHKDCPWIDDPANNTFEVISWSKPPSSGFLNMAFFPIMEDRGVSRENLEQVLRESLDRENEIFECLDSGADLLAWMSQRSFSTFSKGSEAQHLGSLPWSRTARVDLYCKSGFTARSFPPLSELTRSLASDWYSSIVDDMRIPLPDTSIGGIYAIADPLGVLAPGEVHLYIPPGSSQLPNLPFFQNIDVLVARFPCDRNSDMQKVRAVYKSELHLYTNVIVFSSRGRYPLAQKMSNGDYDGDTFWVCWNRLLVEPFQNVPPPPDPSPETSGFSLKQDKELFNSMIDEDSGFDRFLAKSFQFSLEESLLGIVENARKRLAYKSLTIKSSSLDTLATLKEYLVDAQKNGYSFNQQDFRDFKKSFLIPELRDSKIAYELPLDVGVKLETRHINDFLKFRVLGAIKKVLLEQLDQMLVIPNEPDPHLTALYHRKNKGSLKFIATEIDNLVVSLQSLDERYRKGVIEGLRARDKRGDDEDNYFQQLISKLSAEYSSMQPTSNHPVIKEWLEKPAEHAPSMWDLLKASALYARCSRPKQFRGNGGSSKGNEGFIFWLAGRHLCYLKASNSDPRAMPMVTSVSDCLKISRSQLRQMEEASAFDESILNSSQGTNLSM